MWTRGFSPGDQGLDQQASVLGSLQPWLVEFQGLGSMNLSLASKFGG